MLPIISNFFAWTWRTPLFAFAPEKSAAEFREIQTGA
jgi:hypothetical protein